jgi:hypothetical protein
MFIEEMGLGWKRWRQAEMPYRKGETPAEE